MPLVVLLFAVLRCGRPAAATLPLLWCPLAVFYTRHGFGPWAEMPAWSVAPVLAVQICNLLALGTAWLVAALLSERDAAYGRLQHMNLDLEQRVTQRTAEMEVVLRTLSEEVQRRVRAEDGFLELFGRAATPMLLIDPNGGRIMEANAAASEFYGWPLERLRTLSIDAINTLSPERVREELAGASQLTRNHFEFRHRSSRETRFWASRTAGVRRTVPITGSSGTQHL